MTGRSTRRWTQVGIGLTAGALTAGAALALPADAPLGPASASASKQLQRFSDCDAVTAWYVRQALPKVTAWGLDGPPVYAFYAVDDMMRAAVPAAANASPEAVGNGSTGTNVQEQGVDEPDVAKLMGDLVVSVKGHELLVTDVSGSDPVVVGALELPEGWTYELLVVGERVVVTGTQPSYIGWEGDIISTPRVPAFPYPGYGGNAVRSSLTTIDLSYPSAPRVVNRDVIEGSIVTSREHDGTIRVVATSRQTLDFVSPGVGLTRLQALEQNRQIVKNSDASDWLPWRYFDHRGNGGEPLVDCTDIAHPADGAGLGAITVITLDADDPANLQTTAVSADGSLVYASADRLYVATVDDGFSVWGWRGSASEDDDWRHPDTEIHAFSTSGADTAYVASGTVEGLVDDRWAFSEYDGMLRVATSLGSTWSPTQSVITVLDERGDSLVPIGRVDGLGVKEEIKAVRWFGDYAVVVTFRQIDPLYLVDLSDPTDPTILDSLKVPGFSEYLHPVGGDVILGVGQRGGQSGRGIAQVSSFDLSDLHRIDLLPFDHASGTAVADDSRAFTYLPDQRVALIPSYSWRTNSGELQVVSVAVDGSLSLLTSVQVAGWETGSIRTLPLGGDRVALVTGGSVDQVLDVAAAAG